MFSSRIPNNLNYIVSKMVKIPWNDFNHIVKSTQKSINENNYNELNIQSLTTKLKMSIQEIEDLFGLLILLIQYCGRHSYPEKEVKNELIEYGFPEEWSNQFLTLIINQQNNVSVINYMPHIEEFNWRIDTSLRNDAVRKPVPSTIIWKLKLDNGKEYIIEMNIRKFHEIRFNIATLLKELSTIKCNFIKK